MNRLQRDHDTGGWLRLLRRYPRVKLETVVAVAFDGRAMLAHIVDVCEGGLGLTLPADLPDGSRITVSFYLPTSTEVLDLPGVVVHASKDVCGLAFTHITALQRRLLRRYINNRRFLHGDLRPIVDNADVGKRMTERLGKVRRLTLL